MVRSLKPTWVGPLAGLGINVDEALKEYRRSGDLTPVREAMRIAYGDDVYDEGISDMEEEHVD